jgi:hypothetical protein
MTDCGSCGGLNELWQADQIVTGHRQGELEAKFSDPPEHGPRKPADRLAPAVRASFSFEARTNS